MTVQLLADSLQSNAISSKENSAKLLRHLHSDVPHCCGLLAPTRTPIFLTSRLLTAHQHLQPAAISHQATSPCYKIVIWIVLWNPAKKTYLTRQSMLRQALFLYLRHLSVRKNRNDVGFVKHSPITMNKSTLTCADPVLSLHHLEYSSQPTRPHLPNRVVVWSGQCIMLKNSGRVLSL